MYRQPKSNFLGLMDNSIMFLLKHNFKIDRILNSVDKTLSSVEIILSSIKIIWNNFKFCRQNVNFCETLSTEIKIERSVTKQ